MEPTNTTAVKTGSGRIGSRRGLVRGARQLLGFFVGQGLNQIVGAVTGFMLLRWLTVDAYAQVGVTFGFQCTLALLVDLGLSGSLIALVGSRGNDPHVVGGYVRAARAQRNRFFLLMIPPSAVVFHIIAHRQHWAMGTEVSLFVSVVATLFFQGLFSFYASPLLMHHQLRPYYNAQLFGSAARLVAAWFFHILSALTSTVSSWLPGGAAAIAALFCRRSASGLLVEPARTDPAVAREMWAYISPLMPGAIFFAFQSQISLFIIGYFGHSTTIAEVSALGRLTQIAGILGGANGVLIAPHIAKIGRERLFGHYMLVVLGAGAVCGVLVLAGFAFPSVFLLLLGPKYQHLQRETGYSMLLWALNYMSSIFFTLNGARKWVYWWSGVLYMVLTCVVEIVVVLTLDLGTTMHVMYFGLAVSIAILLVQSSTGVYGFIFGPAKRLVSPGAAVA